MDSTIVDPSPDEKSSENGGVRAVVLFIVILAAYVIQSQLTQHVQADLGYQQPYFIFYIAHSSFVAIFPLHILYLRITTGLPYSHFTSTVYTAIRRHLSPVSTNGFPIARLFWLVIGLTLGSTVTALLWYISVAFAPVSDVTALFNTNAFWAYTLSVMCSADLAERRWEVRKLLTVVIACAGVFAVIYGSAHPRSEPTHISPGRASPKVLFGEGIALTASITYAFYQVFYKRFAVLPAGTGPPTLTSSPLLRRDYQPLPREQDTPLIADMGGGADETVEEEEFDPSTDISEQSPPFALHPNFLTSLIGLSTLLIFWVPILVMHLLKVGGDEHPFQFPPNATTWWYIALISLTGVVFNAGFMVLLGIWGPVIVSVGNLLTIVLVEISDVLFGNGLSTITVWSLLGSGMIVGAFAFLAVDVMRH
ncbi:hypothetical protein FRB96_006501 [Tulasnella sp. 330]|nr:hypothetical protein FRB96_006501 [Tulasnella sp. 330]KAG8878769.1 hypothetical protein FRB97_002310 [Tulasnella sp. 331]